MKKSYHVRHSIIFFIIALIILTCKWGFGVDINLIEKITLSQEKDFIQVCVSFAVTADNVFYLSDVKGANIKIFNDKGNLEKTWGQKGPGPNEFFAPLACDFHQGNLAVMDVTKSRIFILERKGKFGLTLKKSLICMSPGLAMTLMDDGILIGSGKTDKSGKNYDLFIQPLDGKEVKFLMPSGIKYGLAPFMDWRKIYQIRPDIDAIGSNGRCDREGENAYYVWEGNLRVITINMKTGLIGSFGEKTGNYVKPVISKRMIEAKQKLNTKAYHEEKSRMSTVESLFAGSRYVGLLYKSPVKKAANHNASSSAFLLQFYTPEGKFLKETVVSDKYSKMLMEQQGNNVYFLGSFLDEDLNEIFEILKYKIIE